MAKTPLDEFMAQVAEFHHGEVRRAFSQPELTAMPASIKAVHGASVRLAQKAREGHSIRTEAIQLAHRAFACWLADQDMICGPQLGLFKGDGAVDVQRMVDEETVLLNKLRAEDEGEDEGAEETPAPV